MLNSYNEHHLEKHSPAVTFQFATTSYPRFDTSDSFSSKTQYSVLEMDLEYQIEARDPLHHWAPELNKALEEYKGSGSEEEFSETKFFEWVKMNKPTLPRTQYLNGTELEACKQQFVAPNLVRPQNAPLHDKAHVDCMKMFVMNEEGEFFLHSKQKPAPGIPGFNHSSFFNGKPVAAVGFMHFNKEGELIAIDDYSGHYKPKKQQVLNAMHALKEKGIDLSKIKYNHRISQDSFDKIIYNAQSWYEENMDINNTLTTSSEKLGM
ncbi:MAG: hypothetical protein HYX61_01350 [Gammaproteobacteria bacterium]|jgi:hypothetical protein|nr:hypothetical protein [Gammaproteobacteria bacterium]